MRDPKYDAPEFAWFRDTPEANAALAIERAALERAEAACEVCDECADPIDETDLAPSCGAHRLHLGACRDWFSCRDCDIEWEEATGE